MDASTAATTHLATAAAKLDSQGIRSILKKVPGLVTTPIVAAAMDIASPELVIASAAVIFAIEKAYTSGKLESVLNTQVAAGRLSEANRDRVVAVAAGLTKAVPLTTDDMILMATLAPELEIAAPLVDRVPALRKVAASVRHMLPARKMLGLSQATVAAAATPALGLA